MPRSRHDSPAEIPAEIPAETTAAEDAPPAADTPAPPGPGRWVWDAEARIHLRLTEDL